MSDPEETYCRLCAEPTPITQLISSDEDVAISSKIATKMLWINIDISTTNNLPTTICFACFDLLERTWTFLHNVRTAQEKLQKIFVKKFSETNEGSKKRNELDNTGKPVDNDWDQFQITKREVKLDPESEMPSGSLGYMHEIKVERNSHDYEALNSRDSTDSDVPLLQAVKKKAKKKKRPKFDSEILEQDLLIKSELEVDAVPLNMVSMSTTWEDYVCRCATCDALCENVASLRLHAMRIHSCCCIFKCLHCGKVLANYKSFVSHARSHQKVLRHCCEYCNRKFSLARYVRKHLNDDHGDDSITTCQNCGACFDNAELLQDHLLMYARTYKKCRKREPEKMEFDLKCEHCNKEFKTRSNLLQHKLVHTERTRDFSCHICGKLFFTKGTLSTHMSTHEETKPYKCEFCPMTFRARGNLTSHASLHSGAKPFVCELCGKSFRVKRHLKSHSIVHTDLMPYVCEYCNKPFRFKTRLNLHLRQHTGAKPYNCVYCQRDFTNGSNFKKHMKRRHNIDTSKKKYNNIVLDQNEGDSSQHSLHIAE